MGNLFLLLFLISLISLIVKLVNPSIFSRFIKGETTRKNIEKILCISTAIFFIASGIFSDTGQKQAAESPTNTTNKEVSQKTQKASNPEDEFKNQLTSLIVNPGSTEVKYMDTIIGKADPDRPKGSKSITVKINVISFLSKKYFIKNTGELSSNIFQTSFSSSLPISDVAVWYYGETKDKYGNIKNDVMQTYVMEKAVYSKINWATFNQSTLCDLLNGEDRSGGNGCMSLVNIQ